jgi:hypothetical protein
MSTQSVNQSVNPIVNPIVNPKIKSEAQRALSNIKSYDLKVFAVTVNLGAINLVDNDEESEKKDKKDKKEQKDQKDQKDNGSDDLLACFKIIRDSAPKCSILLISESPDSLRLMASSVDPVLKSSEWVEAATSVVQGRNLTENHVLNKDFKEPDFTDVVLKMNIGASSLKEKENALAASFAFLRKKGLSEESDDEDELAFNLDSIE